MSNNILSKHISQLPPIKQRIYYEWVRRSSRYRNPFIYLYLACDHKRQVCKVGISVRKPQVRLWDIGFECIHEWYLPNEYARSVEAFITAKYSDKWLREGNQAYNGRRECYPFGLSTELFRLILELLSGYTDLPNNQINGSPFKVIPELSNELMNIIRSNNGRGSTMTKLYSYVSPEDSMILKQILMSDVPQVPKINSKPIGKGTITSNNNNTKFGGGNNKSQPSQSSNIAKPKGGIITKPTSSIGSSSSKRDQGTPKPGGTPTPPKARSVSLGRNPVNSGMNINSGVK